MFGCDSVLMIAASLLVLLDPNGLSQDSCVTPAVMEGPYYSSGSPSKSEICSSAAGGTPLTVTGQVLDSDGQKPIPGATLDVWQANGQGRYYFPSQTGSWECRGKVTADSNGYYRFDTVRPGQYPGRPAHIHLKVAAPGFSLLTTQFYFPGDSRNNPRDHSSDPCAQVQISGNEGRRNIILSRNTIDTSGWYGGGGRGGGRSGGFGGGGRGRHGSRWGQNSYNPFARSWN